MKGGRLQANFGQICLGDFYTESILFPVQLGFDSKPGGGCGASDQVDDRFKAHQRSATPVLSDEGKHPMLNFVPFAGSRRKVADVDAQTGCVGQTLNPNFPQPRPASVAASGVGHNQQLLGVRITFAPHMLPPGQDTVDGKLRCVVVHQGRFGNAGGLAQISAENTKNALLLSVKRYCLLSCAVTSARIIQCNYLKSILNSLLVSIGLNARFQSR